MTFRGLSFTEEERAFLQQRVALFLKTIFLISLIPVTVTFLLDPGGAIYRIGAIYDCGRTPVDPELESLILDCLAKDPSGRPAGAHAVRRRLERCSDFGGWTKDDAHAWWREHGAALSTAPQPIDDSELTLTRQRSDPRADA